MNQFIDYDAICQCVLKGGDLWNELCHWAKCVAQIDALISRNDASTLPNLACCKKQFEASKHRNIEASMHSSDNCDIVASNTLMKKFASN